MNEYLDQEGLDLYDSLLKAELSAMDDDVDDLKSELIHLNPSYTVEITTAVNFNDYLTYGMYTVPTASMAGNISNIPSAVAGVLIVMQTTQSNRISQFYLCNNARCTIYCRYYNGTSFSSWKKIINSDEYDQFLSIIPNLSDVAFLWNLGKSVTNAGTAINNSNFAITDMIPVNYGTIIVNTTNDIGLNNMVTAMFAIYYNNSGGFISRNLLTPNEPLIIRDDSVKNISILYGYGSVNPNPPRMTKELLHNYFSVKVLGNATPMFYGNDGEEPYYVAFGASTTAGAVHHYTGETTTYSKYNYPDYVGKVLGLKPVNLSVGGTGFLERTDSDNNILDQIYNNDEILSKAKLITITFGYGNDHYVGNPSKLFRIGSYDDYYPYDEAGFHPTGQAGLTEMIEKGATLMGCLNWCIKWINEKYPYAQLIVMFASPSANDGRTVTITSQTGSVGIAPRKLVITDPYDTVDEYSIEYGIKQIHTELANLKDTMNIPIVDAFFDGNAFSYYSTYAKNPTNISEYALFSTTGTIANPDWDPHPNDIGYLYFARFIAGKIIGLFKH